MLDGEGVFMEKAVGVVSVVCCQGDSMWDVMGCA